MERLSVQSKWWRALALISLMFALSMVRFDLPYGGFGLNWMTAKALFWLTAIVGLFGYAYGFRFLSLTFWRVYALLFTFEIMWRSMKVAWVPLARVTGWPDDSRYSTLVILLGLVILALPCVALLRYAGLVNGGRTSARPALPEIFA